MLLLTVRKLCQAGPDRRVLALLPACSPRPQAAQLVTVTVSHEIHGFNHTLYLHHGSNLNTRHHSETCQSLKHSCRNSKEFYPLKILNRRKGTLLYRNRMYNNSVKLFHMDHFDMEKEIDQHYLMDGGGSYSTLAASDLHPEFVVNPEIGPQVNSASNDIEKAFSSDHLPDFASVAKTYYTVTKKENLRKIVRTFYTELTEKYPSMYFHYTRNILHKHKSLIYCSEIEIELCVRILKQLSKKHEDLLCWSNLLLLPAETVTSLRRLYQDIGFLCSEGPALSRLEELVLLPENMLVAHDALPTDSSLLPRLLHSLGPHHHHLHQDSIQARLMPSHSVRDIMNAVLAHYLAYRFQVSVSSAEQLLHSHPATLKPLSQYHSICDIIQGDLNINFKQLCERPCLLNMLPYSTRKLLSRQPSLCGRPTVQVLLDAPQLTLGPYSLLARWISLLQQSGVQQFSLSPSSVAVLQQDRVHVASLMLNFLQHHPLWPVIAPSPYLFTVFSRPNLLNGLLMKARSSSCQCASWKQRASPTSAEEERIQAMRERLLAHATADNYDLLEPSDSSEESNVSLPRPRVTASTDNVLHRKRPSWTPKVKFRPSVEVMTYLMNKLAVEDSEVHWIGWNVGKTLDLLNVTLVMQLLTRQGFNRDQMVAAIEVFGFDVTVISEELSLLPDRYPNYESYWKTHPNVLNLLLLHVRPRCSLRC